MGRRALAWSLIAYGLAGLALAITGAIVGLDMATRVERLAGDADGALAAAARATRAASDSFANVDTSLSDAEASVDAASVLSRDAATTLRSLAAAMEISIFGSRPLQPLADDFSTSADQADALADTLDDAGGSLGDTRTDVAAIGTELGTLADRLESIQGADPDEDAPPIRLFVAILLVWLLLPAIGALVIGVTLLRRPLVVVVAPAVSDPRPDIGP